MPAGYGFLKYGKPMAAAAPLLLALNLLPAPAHACTGNDNDPLFCGNNNGQVVNGFGTFFLNDLLILPGSTTVGEGGTVILNPVTVDLTKLGNTISTSNTTTGFGGGSSGSGVSSFPVVPGGTAPGGDPGGEGQGGTFSNVSRLGQPLVNELVIGVSQNDGFQKDPSSDGQFGSANDLIVFGPDGNLPPSLARLVAESILGRDAVPGDSSVGCSQSSPAVCSQEFEPLFETLQVTLDPEHQVVILSELPDFEFAPPDDDDLQLDTSGLLPPGEEPVPTGELREQLQQYNLDSDDPLVQALILRLVRDFGSVNTNAPEDETQPTGPQGESFPRVEVPSVTTTQTPRENTSGGSGFTVTEAPSPDNFGSANADSGQTFVERKISALRRLRARAEAEQEPDRKKALQDRVERFENQIRAFGSDAMKAALQKEDNRGAPVPTRGG